MQWATSAIFFVNGILAFLDFWRLLPTSKMQSEEPLQDTLTQNTNGFLSMCVTAMIAEACVNLLGIMYVLEQTLPSDPNQWMSTDKPVDLRAYRKMQISATGLMASTVTYTLFLIFLLWWMSAKACCGPREKRGTTDLRRLFRWLSGMWVLTLGTFVFSWMLWKTFLENTDKSNYCIEDAGMLDAVFWCCPCYWDCEGIYVLLGKPVYEMVVAALVQICSLLEDSENLRARYGLEQEVDIQADASQQSTFDREIRR